MRCALMSFLLIFGSGTAAADWLTLPSTYSHDPATGLRVHQYQPVPAPTAPVAPNYRSSGYHHTRSTLNYGPSTDHYHRVERWGEPVRPYGEWQRPYRPYSVPYRYWGEPYGGLDFHFGRPRRGYRHGGEHRLGPRDRAGQTPDGGAW